MRSTIQVAFLHRRALKIKRLNGRRNFSASRSVIRRPSVLLKLREKDWTGEKLGLANAYPVSIPCDLNAKLSTKSSENSTLGRFDDAEGGSGTRAIVRTWCRGRGRGTPFGLQVVGISEIGGREDCRSDSGSFLNR